MHNTSQGSINIIVKNDFLSGIDFKESVDLALVCAAFEQKVSLIFIDNGVNNLLIEQNTPLLACKNQADIIKGLEFYDIQALYVEQESLEQRMLSDGDIMPNHQVNTRKELCQRNLDADKVIII